MSITIKADHKSLPKGEILDLSGIAAVPNGDSVTLDEEQEVAFKLRFPDGLPEKSFFKVTGTPSKASANVEVTTPDGGEN